MKKFLYLSILIFVINSYPLYSINFGLYFGASKIYNYNEGYQNLYEKFNYKPDDISIAYSLYSRLAFVFPEYKNHWVGLDFQWCMFSDIVKINDSVSFAALPAFFNIGLSYAYSFELGSNFFIGPICKGGVTLPKLSLRSAEDIDTMELNRIVNEAKPDEYLLRGTGYYFFLGTSIEWSLDRPPKKIKTIPQEDYRTDNPISYYKNHPGAGITLEIGYTTSLINRWDYYGYKVNGMSGYAFKGFIISLQLVLFG